MSARKPDPMQHALDFERPIMELEQKIIGLEELAEQTSMDLTAETRPLRELRDKLMKQIFASLTPWQMVRLARHPLRPVTTDYVNLICEDVIELHGDRLFGDDRAIMTALAKIGDERVVLIAHRKGKTTEERLATNFGCAHPEGYRKALAKMKLAEKFGLPVITFINTPGAYPGIGAEERGQASAIALNIMEMSHLRVPIVSCVIGEGGSGGALGIGVCDRLLVLEYAYYSVISPEGCAAILWKSGEKAEEAATALKLTAKDLHGFGIVDEIVPEPLGGAHRDHAKTAILLRDRILRNFKELKQLDTDELLTRRYARYREIGNSEAIASQVVSGRKVAEERLTAGAPIGGSAGGRAESE